MAWVSARELDWDALYSDQLPRIYNYFRSAWARMLTQRI
jgi:hypothetical protein